MITLKNSLDKDILIVDIADSLMFSIAFLCSSTKNHNCIGEIYRKHTLSNRSNIKHVTKETVESAPRLCHPKGLWTIKSSEV